MEPIHERTIKIKTFEMGEDRILIEGTLIDERFCPTFAYLISRIIGPKIVHNITVGIELSLPDLVIRSVNTNMTEVPAEVCKGAKDACDKLVGVSLLRGFKRTVKKLMGGVNGCLHLNTLLLSIGAYAFQGSHAYYHRVQDNGRLREIHLDESIVVNSCHVWKESGPFAPRLKEIVQSAKDARIVKQ